MHACRVDDASSEYVESGPPVQVRLTSGLWRSQIDDESSILSPVLSIRVRDRMTALIKRRPSIRALSQHECFALLERNRVGRLAFALRGQVDIQPLHYAYGGGWIYGRTSEGAKLTTLAHHQWVAFEVDEVHDAFDWVSVVIHGSFHRLDADSPVYDAAAEAHAVGLLRSIVPETYMLEDPVPFRTVVFRIALGEMTGRAATTEDRRLTTEAEREPQSPTGSTHG